MVLSLLPIHVSVAEWGEDLDVFQIYCLLDHEPFIGTAAFSVSEM